MERISMNAKRAKAMGATAAKNITEVAEVGDYIINCSTMDIKKLTEEGLDTWDKSYYKKVEGDLMLEVAHHNHSFDEQVAGLEDQIKKIKILKEENKVKFIYDYVVGDTMSAIVVRWDKLGDEMIAVEDIKLREGDELIHLGRRYNHSPRKNHEGSSHWAAIIKISGIINQEVVSQYVKDNYRDRSDHRASIHDVIDKTVFKSLEKVEPIFKEFCDLIIK